jgi:Asp-tRNA(Asn)/Glu-tRNA(Gln) amidotransferase A subunit family amidase
METTPFNIVEATIDDHRKALDAGHVRSLDLVISALLRIGTYDIRGGLNAMTVFNPRVFEEAAESDRRRTLGLPPRPLEGIPYTLKDSYKYSGMSATNGSPALVGLQSSADSAIAAKLRAAGAVMIGKTNMPPMAAGGMQRGLYGRAESAYNRKYLTAAFSSGSSNGAATSVTTSMAAFGMASETVSSGRSPASNNALTAYTPSKGVLPCRGLWPLYVTCDVPVPYTRSVKDMLEILSVITMPDEETKGDFWREQTFITLPKPQALNYLSLAQPDALSGKRIGVPKMYIGQNDSHPHAKPTATHPGIMALWEAARADLEALGAEIVYTDFPLVTNYEDDSVSNEANNVVGAPAHWNAAERGELIAKAWDDFLKENNDPKLQSLKDVDPHLLFPKPKDYLPDRFLEARNWINYAGLPDLAAQYEDTALMAIPGLEQALKALEAQRKRDLEDWMDEFGLDCIAFPANGDVGLADLEYNLESARHSLQNGVKYSHGNRAIRHLGVPTVSVPMGVLPEHKMPVNLTFAGKAYDDGRLLQYAYAYERKSQRRVIPPLSPGIETDIIARTATPSERTRADLKVSVEAFGGASRTTCHVVGTLHVPESGDIAASLEVYLDGMRHYAGPLDNRSFDLTLDYVPHDAANLSWDLKPLPPRQIMVLIVAKADGGAIAATVVWADR